VSAQSKEGIAEWLDLLRQGIGSQAEIRIRDMAGLDPASPPKLFTLHDVKLSGDGQHLVCYLNDIQHVSIPVYDGSSLESTASQLRFESKDERAELLYSLTVNVQHV
jgi:hypothetical protein